MQISPLILLSNHEASETLSADAKKLADQIVKKLDSDIKQQVAAAKAS